MGRVSHEITTDLEGGFIVGREFMQPILQSGTIESCGDSRDRALAGKIERHNQTIKEMTVATIRQTSPIGREDMRKLAREVA